MSKLSQDIATTAGTTIFKQTSYRCLADQTLLLSPTIFTLTEDSDYFAETDNSFLDKAKREQYQFQRYAKIQYSSGCQIFNWREQDAYYIPPKLILLVKCNPCVKSIIFDGHTPLICSMKLQHPLSSWILEPRVKFLWKGVEDSIL
ncbi:hypothetical protein CEXT_681351 [Caerostris extrusa]|uniref:Uncharacterized protein n=1 Tax=Caerostris extrusa TaxID=172846 RepID=A0AAV4RAK2_CAEEX|nr:hypothetical protein CEXT_681351 [Caerostris extrusa]